MQHAAVTPIATLTSERQIFIDDGFVSDSRGLRRTLHRPLRYECNPVLVGCFPWEGDRVTPDHQLVIKADGEVMVNKTETEASVSGD